MRSDGFFGAFDLANAKDYKNPVLVSSTDGVGTKLEICRILDDYSPAAEDLIAMTVDDIAVAGAKPLFLTDYIAIGPDNSVSGEGDNIKASGYSKTQNLISYLIDSIKRECDKIGCKLLAGETAMHNTMKPFEVDLAASVTGIVDKDDLLDGSNILGGEVIVAFASSGLHSNGFSFVRNILDALNIDYTTYAKELLEPTRIYINLCLELVDKINCGQDKPLKAFSHITGGGMATNIARVIPEGCAANIEREKLKPFEFLYELKDMLNRLADDIPQEIPKSQFDLRNMEHELNMGVGMAAICEKDIAQRIIDISKENNIDAYIIGEVNKKDGASSVNKGIKSGICSLTGLYLSK